MQTNGNTVNRSSRQRQGHALCGLLLIGLMTAVFSACSGGDAAPGGPDTDAVDDMDTHADTSDTGEDTGDTRLDDVHRPAPEPLPPETPPGVPPQPASVAVRISGPDGPLEGALVQVGATVARTDVRGDAFLPRVAVGHQVVRVSSEGFASQMRRLSLTEGDELILRLDLAPAPPPVEFLADEGGEASDGALALEVPAGAVVNDRGEVYTGTITLRVQDFDPFDTASAAAYPATLEAELVDGSAGMLETFGVLEATLRDEDGMLLQVAPGETLPVRRAIPADVGLSVGDEVPMWWLDTTTGLWQEEPGVVAIVVEEDGELFMETALPHLSTWNFDVFFGGPCSIELSAEPTDPSARLPGYSINIRGPAGLNRWVRSGPTWWTGVSERPLRFLAVGPGDYSIAIHDNQSSDEPIEEITFLHTCPGNTAVSIEIDNAIACPPGEEGCLPAGEDTLYLEAINGNCPTRLRAQVRGMTPETAWTVVPSDGILRGHRLRGETLEWRWFDGPDVVLEGSSTFASCDADACSDRWRVDVDEEYAYFPIGGCRVAPCTECTGCLEVEVVDAVGEPAPDVRLDVQEPIGLTYTSGSDGGLCADSSTGGDAFVVYTGADDLLGSAVLPRDGTCETGGCARRRVMSDGREWRCPEGAAFLPIRSARRMGIENVGYRTEVRSSDVEGPEEARLRWTRNLPEEEQAPIPTEDPLMLGDFAFDESGWGSRLISRPWAIEVLSRDLAGVERVEGLRIGFPGHRAPAVALLDGFGTMDPVMQMRIQFPQDDALGGQWEPIEEGQVTLSLYDVDTPSRAGESRWERPAVAGSMRIRLGAGGRVNVDLQDVRFSCEACDEFAPGARGATEEETHTISMALHLEDRSLLEPSFTVQRSNPFVGAWYSVHRFDDDLPWLFGPTGAPLDVEEERQEVAGTRWCIPTSGAPVQMVGERFPGTLVPISPLIAADGSRHAAWEGARVADTRPWLQIKPRWWDVDFVEAMYNRVLGPGQWRDPVEEVATIIGQATSEDGAILNTRRAELVDTDGTVVQEAIIINVHFDRVEGVEGPVYFFPSIPAGSTLDDRLSLRVYAGDPEEELPWMRQSFVPFPGGVLVPLD